MARSNRPGARRFRRDITRTRRLLKRLPDAARDELLQVFRQEGPVIEAYGRANAPRRRGALARALRFTVNQRSLSARFGIIGRKANRDLFYARILELGRKAGQSRLFQRRLKSGGLSKRYRVRVKAIARGRFDFVFGRAAQFAFERLRPRLKSVWEGALRRVSGVN